MSEERPVAQLANFLCIFFEALAAMPQEIAADVSLPTCQLARRHPVTIYFS
jgi:hypothetical protein